MVLDSLLDLELNGNSHEDIDKHTPTPSLSRNLREQVNRLR